MHRAQHDRPTTFLTSRSVRTVLSLDRSSYVPQSRCTLPQMRRRRGSSYTPQSLGRDTSGIFAFWLSAVHEVHGDAERKVLADLRGRARGGLGRARPRGASLRCTRWSSSGRSERRPRTFPGARATWGVYGATGAAEDHAGAAGGATRICRGRAAIGEIAASMQSRRRNGRLGGGDIDEGAGTSVGAGGSASNAHTWPSTAEGRSRPHQARLAIKPTKRLLVGILEVGRRHRLAGGVYNATWTRGLCMSEENTTLREAQASLEWP